MGATLDHVGIPATQPQEAAAFLAWVLGEGEVVPDGPLSDDAGDMYSLLLDGWSLVFVRVQRPSPHHLAIRVEHEQFSAAIERLTGRGVAFGNDPEDVTNGRTEDPLGTRGRAYFCDPNGHLYELVVAGTGVSTVRCDSQEAGDDG